MVEKVGRGGGRVVDRCAEVQSEVFVMQDEDGCV